MPPRAAEALSGEKAADTKPHSGAHIRAPLRQLLLSPQMLFYHLSEVGYSHAGGRMMMQLHNFRIEGGWGARNDPPASPGYHWTNMGMISTSGEEP